MKGNRRKRVTWELERKKIGRDDTEKLRRYGEGM